MEVVNSRLVQVFKAKLLLAKANNLSTLFRVPAVDAALVTDCRSVALFHKNLLPSNIQLSEVQELTAVFATIFLVKEQLSNLTIALGRFVTSKKREFDFRITSEPIPMEFKLFTTALLFGGSAKLEKMKLSAAVKLPQFNYASFIRSQFVADNHLEYLFPYIKTFDFYFRRTLFKRLSFSYFKLYYGISLLSLSIAILRKCIFMLHGYARVRSIPPGVHKGRWKWVKLKDKIVRKLRMTLSSNFFFAELGLFSIRDLPKSLAVLLSNAERFHEPSLKTGLVLYVSEAAKTRASKGVIARSEYADVRHFNFHYPFTPLDFRPEAPRPINRTFFKPKWRKANLFSKFVWWPKRFNETFLYNKSFIDKGIFLNGYKRKHAFVNIDMIRVLSKLYPLFFAKTFKIFEFEKFNTFTQKINFPKK